MIRQVSQSFANKLADLKEITVDKKDVYAYGCELMLSSLAGILVVMATSLCFKKPFLWIPYIIGFGTVRFWGGGYHAKTHLHCIAMFAALYSIALAVNSMHEISLWELFGFCCTSGIVCLAYAPIAAPNKPLSMMLRRKNRRCVIYLSMINLGGIVVVILLQIDTNDWLRMYYTGNLMAVMSMLLTVIIEKGRI